MMTSRRAEYSALVGAAAITIGVILASIWVHSSLMTGETGLVEQGTLVLYSFAIIVLLSRRYFGMSIAWSAVFALVFCLLRELDFDKRFTSIGLLKTRLYFTDTAPIYERLIGIAVVVALVAVVLTLIVRHGRIQLRRLIAFDPVAIGIFAGLALMGLSKAIDGIGRKLSDIGINISEESVWMFDAVEEALEFGVPLFFLTSAILSIISITRGEEQQAAPLAAARHG